MSQIDSTGTAPPSPSKVTRVLRMLWAEAVWKRCPVVSFHKAVGGRDGTFHRWHRPGTGHAFP